MKNGNPVNLRGFDLGVASASIYDHAPQLHANFARITVPWSDVEPTAPTGKPGHLKHHWATGYLNMLDQEVQELGAQGVQVLIDFHQYHWSPYFAQAQCTPGNSKCYAEGIPAWFYANRYPDSKAAASVAKADWWSTGRRTSLFYYSQFAEMMARRYGHQANVIGYEAFNEPHFGRLPDNTQSTNLSLGWQHQIARVIHAVDPSRVVVVMCRGGGEGVGTANLAQFRGEKIALDFHDYYNGDPGTGLNAAGDDWTPSWEATHNQTLDPTTGYTGTEAAQASVLGVPIQAARKAGIPLIVGEWGIHEETPHADTYTSQMLNLFAQNNISWSRWILAPGDGFNMLGATTGDPPDRQGLQIGANLAADPTLGR